MSYVESHIFPESPTSRTTPFRDSVDSKLKCTPSPSTRSLPSVMGTGLPLTSSSRPPPIPSQGESTEKPSWTSSWCSLIVQGTGTRPRSVTPGVPGRSVQKDVLRPVKITRGDPFLGESADSETDCRLDGHPTPSRMIRGKEERKAPPVSAPDFGWVGGTVQEGPKRKWSQRWEVFSVMKKRN